MSIQVLKGGLDPSNQARYSFITGAVSDTRLMGVIAMHLVFSDNIQGGSFHQFYYYDYEELGLEHMTLLRSDDPDEISVAVRTAFAGLGAAIVEISEKEGRYIAQQMVKNTIAKGQPLPPELDQCSFLLPEFSEEITLNSREIDFLNVKLCTPIKSDYGLINYYLMRVFGNDDAGARLLLLPGLIKAGRASEKDSQGSILELAALAEDEKLSQSAGGIENISSGPHCTFLKNKITLISGTNGDNKTYRCESLVGIDKYSSHSLIVSEIDVYKRRIAAVRKISQQNVSLFEASILLNKKEYVTVYEIRSDADLDLLSAGLYEFAIGMTRNSHPAGEMFIRFMPDNSHAENKIFMLNDDIHSLYFVSQANQIVVAAYSYNAILHAEDDIVESDFDDCLEIVGRYSFEESLIYDFAESGLDNFLEYIGVLE